MNNNAGLASPLTLQELFCDYPATGDKGVGLVVFDHFVDHELVEVSQLSFLGFLDKRIIPIFLRNEIDIGSSDLVICQHLGINRNLIVISDKGLDRDWG